MAPLVNVNVNVTNLSVRCLVTELRRLCHDSRLQLSPELFRLQG